MLICVRCNRGQYTNLFEWALCSMGALHGRGMLQKLLCVAHVESWNNVRLLLGHCLPQPCPRCPTGIIWLCSCIQAHVVQCRGNITQMPGKQQNVVAAVLATCDKLHLLLII